MCCKLAGLILQPLYMILEMNNVEILDALPRKNQICKNPNSKILIMYQSEENLWSFRIESHNFTQYNFFVIVVYTVFQLLPLFDNFVRSKTFYYLLFYNFCFSKFYTCLIPPANTIPTWEAAGVFHRATNYNAEGLQIWSQKFPLCDNQNTLPYYIQEKAAVVHFKLCSRFGQTLDF